MSQRTAGVLDPGTRTLLTEVQLAGAEALFAGSFVRVRLLIEREAPPMLIPASALAIRSEGPHGPRGGGVECRPAARGRAGA